jgi:hypothetical protein
MSETDIVQKIRLKAAEIGMFLFRNNIGKLQDINGRWIAFGVGGTGGSDLIGGTEININGKTLCVLTAVEVKDEGYATKEQVRFLEGIRKRGGLGILARSPEDVVRAKNDFVASLSRPSPSIPTLPDSGN